MPDAPRQTAGPDLRHLFIGSEGVMGVVTDVTLRLFELPETRLYETFFFEKIGDGLASIRAIMQRGLQSFLVRLYDADEAPLAMKDDTLRQPVLFLGCEGPTACAEAELASYPEIFAEAGARPVGPEPVGAWMERRFDVSATEQLLARLGGLAETIKVAVGWDRIGDVYARMRSALTPLVDEVLGHFSHAYSHGTSLYLILLDACDDDAAAEERLLRIWDTAMRECMAAGAAISHHHGIGYARRGVVAPYLGEAYSLIKGVKQVFDPQGILNPGKLV